MAVELGVGYISIVPSAKGFQARLEKLIAGVPAVIDVKADTTKAAVAIQRQLGNVASTVSVKASLDQQSVGAVKSAVSKIDVTPDTRGFFDKLKSVFTRQSTTVDVAPNTSNFASKLRSQVGDQSALGRTIGETAGEGFASSFLSAAKRTVAAVATVFAAQRLIDVGKTAFGTAADFEQTEVAFKGLLGNVDLAEQKLDELQRFAAATPFNFPQLSDAARKLLAFGFSAEEIIPTMEKLGNAAAALGASDTDINLVVRALGQISTKGRVQLEELNQIAEAFPGANPIPALAASVNKSVPEFTAALSQPGGALAAFGLTGEQAVKVILNGFTEINGAAGAMERQSKTLKGALSTLSDTLRIMAIQSLRPFLPGIADFIIRTVVPAVEKLGARVPAVIHKVVESLKPLVGGFKALAVGFKIFRKELDSSTVTGKGIKNLNDVFAHLGDIVSKVLDGFRIFRQTLDRDVKANPGIHNLNDIFAHLADFVVNATDKFRAFGKIAKTAFDAFSAGFNGTTGAAGLIGVIEKIGAVTRQVLGTTVPNIINTLILSFRALKLAFQSEDVTSDGLVGAFERVGVAASKLVTFFMADVVGGIRALVNAFKTGGDDITSSGFNGHMERVGQALRDIVDTVKNNQDIFGPIVAALSGLAVALVAVSKASPILGVLSGVLGSLGTAIGVLTSPLGLVLGAIAALGAAAFIAYKKFTPFKAAVDSVAQTFKRAGFGAAVDEAGTQFGRLFEIVKPKLIEFRDKAFAWLKDHGPEIFAGVGTAIGGIFSFVGTEVLQPLGAWIKDAAAPWLKDKITTEWGPAFFDWIRDTAIPMTLAKLPEFVDAITQWIRDHKAEIAAVTGTLADAAVDWIENIAIPALQERLPGIIATLTDFFIRNVEPLGRQIGSLLMDTFFEGVIQKLPDLALRIPGELAILGIAMLGGLVAGIIGPDGIAVLEQVATTVINFVKGLPGRIAEAAVGMWDGIPAAFRTAINAIIDIWNGLHFRLEIPDSVFGIPVPGGGRGIDFQAPPLEHLAGGGVFSKATTGFFQLAETPAARPEIVTPQKLLAATFRKELATVGAGGGGGVTFGDIVVNGAQASPSSIADAVFAKAGWLHFTGRREL